VPEVPRPADSGRRRSRCASKLRTPRRSKRRICGEGALEPDVPAHAISWPPPRPITSDLRAATGETARVGGLRFFQRVTANSRRRRRRGARRRSVPARLASARAEPPALPQHRAFHGAAHAGIRSEAQQSDARAVRLLSRPHHLVPAASAFAIARHPRDPSRFAAGSVRHASILTRCARARSRRPSRPCCRIEAGPVAEFVERSMDQAAKSAA